MTTQRATIERSLLPRGLLARRSFRFAINETVVFHDMYATIIGRSHTLRGEEIYEIEIDCPERTVRGQYLHPLPAPYAAALMAA
jgi:hypothetical protein